MALKRYNSQAQVPLQPVAMMDKGAFQFQTAQAKGLGQLGAGVGELGQDIARVQHINQQLAERTKDNTDRLLAARVNSAVDVSKIKIDSIYTTERDPLKWEASVEKELSLLKKETEKHLSGMSPETREFVLNALNENELTVRAKYDANYAVKISTDVYETEMAAYEYALSAGDFNKAALVEESMRSHWNDYFVSEQAFELNLNKVKNRATNAGIQNELTSMAAEIGWDGVNDFISDPNNIKSLISEYGVSINDIGSFMNSAKQFASLQADKEKVQSEKVWNDQAGEFESKVIETLFNGDYDGAKTLIDSFNTEIPGEYQSKAAQLKLKYKDRLDATLKTLATEAKESAKIESNEAVVYSLNNMALDIWRGNATKKDFDDALNDARYGKMVDGKLVYTFGDTKSDKPLLDDVAYRTVSTKAAERLRSTQAEELNRAVRAAQDVILGVDSSLFTFDANGRVTGVNNKMIFDKDKTDEIKHRFNAVNLYETALREWITNNPEKSGKEFYTYAEGLKMQYWDKSQSEIEAMNNRRKEELKMPRPKSRAERDALPKGTRFIDPNGAIRIR